MQQEQFELYLDLLRESQKLRDEAQTFERRGLLYFLAGLAWFALSVLVYLVETLSR